LLAIALRAPTCSDASSLSSIRRLRSRDAEFRTGSMIDCPIIDQRRLQRTAEPGPVARGPPQSDRATGSISGDLRFLDLLNGIALRPAGWGDRPPSRRLSAGLWRRCARAPRPRSRVISN
jgi:hypothetical protein